MTPYGWFWRKKYHLSGKLVHILKALHLGTKGAVRVYERVSSNFDVTNGVREGAVLEPVLFNLLFDTVIAVALLAP